MFKVITSHSISANQTCHKQVIIIIVIIIIIINIIIIIIIHLSNM